MNKNGIRGLLATSALIVTLVGYAPPAHAASWIKYWGTTTPLPYVPNYASSSGSSNQSIGAVDLTSCSGGTWTKYIDIRTSSDILHYYSGTACGGAYPGHTDTSVKSWCYTSTSGSNYANCLRWS